MWTVQATYELSLAVPPPAAPAQPSAPPAPELSPWTPVGTGCVVGSGMDISCQAAVPDGAQPADAIASTQIPFAAGTYVGVFLLQSQNFSESGFPAPLALRSADGSLLWSWDLPVTPSGLSCQMAGVADCPVGAGLQQAPRPSCAAPLLPADALMPATMQASI